MESSPSFGIFRTFGHEHTRMLLLRESSLAEKSRELAMLDKSDELGGPTTHWRLRGRFQDGRDTTRIDLEQSIEKELLAYGKYYPFPSDKETLLTGSWLQIHSCCNLKRSSH